MECSSLKRTVTFPARMAAVIKSVSFDAADALALARFWAAVFGSAVDEDSTADKAFVEAAGWGGPNIWFVRVQEQAALRPARPRCGGRRSLGVVRSQRRSGGRLESRRRSGGYLWT
jgi:hypothetical protein